MENQTLEQKRIINEFLQQNSLTILKSRNLSQTIQTNLGARYSNPTRKSRASIKAINPETETNIFSKGFFICCNSKKQKNNLSKFQKRDSIKQTNLQIKNINPDTIINIIEKLDEEQRFKKAVRHFWDAYLYRSARHDFDDYKKQFINKIWSLQNNQYWIYFNLILSYIYLLLSFFEPGNRHSEKLDSQEYKIVFVIELIIIIFYCLDFILNFIQKSNIEGSTIINFLSNKKQALRTLFMVLLFADFMYYYTSQQQKLRFARVCRPLQIITFSKDLRRNMKGILKTFKGIIILFLFYIAVICLYAFLGTMLIGDIGEEIYQNDYAFQYNDFGKLFTALYMVSTLDLYPDLMLPSIQISYYYLLYFIPFIILFMLVFVPIPVAVVYNGFRKHRVDILIEDRLKRRDALLALFLCIDIEKKGYLDQNQFMSLFSTIYKGIYDEQHAINISHSLFEKIDDNNNKKVSIDELFCVIDIIETVPLFSLDHYKSPQKYINNDTGKQVAASRILRIAKIQKAFRLFKALRTIKILSFFVVGFEIFNQVRSMFFKIAMCLPVVFQLCGILWIAFYVYATIGVEIFATNGNVEYKKDSPYDMQNCSVRGLTFQFSEKFDDTDCQYADYNTYGGAFLIQLQVSMAAGWSFIVYDYAYKFDNFYQSMLFFVSLQFICIFLLALIGGMVWEVFNVIEESYQEQEMQQQENNQNIENNQDDVDHEDIQLAEQIIKEHQMRKQLFLDQQQSKQITINSSIQQQFSKRSPKNTINPIQTKPQLLKKSTSSDNNIIKNFQQNKQGSFLQINSARRGSSIQQQLYNQKNSKKLSALATLGLVDNSKQSQNKKSQVMKKALMIGTKHAKEIMQLNNPLENDDSILQITDSDDLNSFNSNVFFDEEVSCEIVPDEEQQNYDQQNTQYTQSNIKQYKNSLTNTIISDFNITNIETNHQLLSQRTSRLFLSNDATKNKQILDNNYKDTLHDIGSHEIFINEEIKQQESHKNLHFQEQKDVQTPQKTQNNFLGIIKNGNHSKSETKSDNNQNNDKLTIPISKKSILKNNIKQSNQNSLPVNTQNKSNSLKQILTFSSLQNQQNTVNSNKQSGIFKYFSYHTSQNDIVGYYNTSLKTIKQMQTSLLISTKINFMHNMCQEDINEYARMIKQDLRSSQQQHQQKENITSNQNALTNLALLKGQDVQKLKEQELEYFKNIYGGDFEKLVNQSMIPFWNLQSKSLFHLKNILKYEQFSIKYTFQILLAIEKQLSSILQTKNCYCKFLFKSQDNKWFTLRYQLEKFQFERIGHGPWRYFDEIFTEDKINQTLLHFQVFQQLAQQQNLLDNNASASASANANLNTNNTNSTLNSFADFKNININKKNEKQKQDYKDIQTPNLVHNKLFSYFQTIQKLSQNYHLENQSPKDQQASNILYVALKNKNLNFTNKNVQENYENDLSSKDNFTQQKISSSSQSSSSSDSNSDEESQNSSQSKSEQTIDKNIKNNQNFKNSNDTFSEHSSQKIQFNELKNSNQKSQRRKSKPDAKYGIENIVFMVYLEQNNKPVNKNKSSLNSISENKKQQKLKIQSIQEEKNSQEKEGLQIQHTVDLVEDIKDIIVKYQDNFFLKVSEILYYRKKYQHI